MDKHDVEELSDKFSTGYRCKVKTTDQSIFSRQTGVVKRVSEDCVEVLWSLGGYAQYKTDEEGGVPEIIVKDYEILGPSNQLPLKS
jgi:hypothetical protein